MLTGKPNDLSYLNSILWNHQKEAIHFTIEKWRSLNRGVFLAMDMGTGKTLTSLSLICSMNIERVLVFCPKSVCDVWESEVLKHIPGYSRFTANLGDGKLSKRLEIFYEYQKANRFLIITNYESICVGRNDAFAKALFSTNWQLVICDEVHRIKKPGGVRSRWLSRIADRTPTRLGLSGTPIPHSPLDAYAQFRFLDKSIFGVSFLRFKYRYSIPGKYPGQILGWQNQEEFRSKLKSIMFQVKADDVLDLPPFVDQERFIELSSSSRSIYNSMQEEFIAWVDAGKMVTASNALVRLIRLQQITSGFTVVDNEEEVIGDEKASELASLIEEIDEPFVVFCRFRNDVNRVLKIARDFNVNSFELSGSRNQLSEWKTDVHANRHGCLACQIQAGKEGVDLSAASIAIYYSLGFSLGDFEQSRARLRRPGQRGNFVRYIHLICKRTIDQKIHRALKSKHDVVESILKEVKDERKSGRR